MLIMAFLQLAPGIFALLNHYALGKFSKNKANDLRLFFILGAFLTSTLFFLAIYYLVSVFSFGDLISDNYTSSLCFGIIFIVLAMFCLFFYYHRGKNSRLFISRSLARALDHNAYSISSRTDAMRLGLFSTSCEFLLTIPLYVITSICLIKIESSGFPIGLLMISFLLVPILPLIFISWQYRSSYTLADILKNRIKNKPLIRIVLCFSFFLIAALIFFSGVKNV